MSSSYHISPTPPPHQTPYNPYIPGGVKKNRHTLQYHSYCCANALFYQPRMKGKGVSFQPTSYGNISSTDLFPHSLQPPHRHMLHHILGPSRLRHSSHLQVFLTCSVYIQRNGSSSYRLHFNSVKKIVSDQPIWKRIYHYQGVLYFTILKHREFLQHSNRSKQAF